VLCTRWNPPWNRRSINCHRQFSQIIAFVVTSRNDAFAVYRPIALSGSSAPDRPHPAAILSVGRNKFGRHKFGRHKFGRHKKRKGRCAMARIDFSSLPRENPCAQCGTPIAVPEWVEAEAGRTFYLWRCRACDYRFEAVAYFDSETNREALAA
jgi:hypothetical protein